MRRLIILLSLLLLMTCGYKRTFDLDKPVPASWGVFIIDPVANEPLLVEVWIPTEPLSGCGLSNDDFMKYARSKVNYERPFQFIVFTGGKPLVGKRCFRTALIFYLKE